MSTRGFAGAGSVLVPVVDDETAALVEIAPGSLTGGGAALDPAQPYRHVTELVDDGEPCIAAGIDWGAAVAARPGRWPTS